MGINKNKNEDLPLVIRVNVVHTTFDIDAVDAEIYCVNTTGTEFSIATKSESFTTIDEETGLAAEHGSASKIISLASGASALIAEVKGWEWDGHVGINLSFRAKGNDVVVSKSYNFKTSNADFTIASSGKTGRIIPPTT
jgi:hypothetical protein